RVFNDGTFETGTTQVSPRTTCSISRAGGFLALPTAGNVDVQDRYLRLDDTQTFGVAQVDQDGGGLKALDFSNLIARAGQKSSVDTPDNWATPVLRSRGLGVFRTGRALMLHTDKFTRATSFDGSLTTGANGPGDNVLLHAEDLMQGARFDAMDTSVAG